VTPRDSPPGLHDASEQFSFQAPDGWLESIARRVAELLAARDASTPEPWVGVREVATHLGCRPQRVYDLVHRKEGGRLVFKLSQLDRWIDSGGGASSHRRTTTRSR
jgi:hypothetical protein